VPKQVDQEGVKVKGVEADPCRRARGKMPPHEVQARQSAIGDSRQKLAAEEGGRAQTPANEKEREDSGKCGGEMKSRWRNSEGWRPLYLAEAAGGAMHGALPEQATPNPIGLRDGRSRKGLPFGRPLDYK